MRHLASVFLTAFVLLGVSGCNDSPLSPLERSELDLARARWTQYGSADYTVESRVSCFCPPHLVFWTRLTVRGGKVVAAEPVAPLPSGYTPSVSGWVTVEQAFAIMASEQSPSFRDVSASYDQQLGYSLEISIRCDSGLMDCGSTTEMRNLQIP